MASLEKKVVLITGASSGIGAGTAKYFAVLKCRLSLVGRNEASLNEVAEICRQNGSPEVLVLSKDLSDAKCCQSAVQETLDYFKELDVFVNSAGILMNGSTEKLSIEDYDKCMNINTRSAFVLTQACLPHMLAKGKGNIVHISSVTGIRAFPNVVAYNMSKAALDQLTRTCALEVASRGIRVNAVNPGVIITDVHKKGGMSDDSYKAFLEHCKTTHAMERVGTVDEVAKTVAFLASDDSSFITGQTLAIDGGRSIMCPR